jgi:hypothetical protein
MLKFKHTIQRFKVIQKRIKLSEKISLKITTKYLKKIVKSITRLGKLIIGKYMKFAQQKYLPRVGHKISL